MVAREKGYRLNQDNQRRITENIQLEAKLATISGTGYPSREILSKDDQLVVFSSGHHCNVLYKTDQFILMMMKLRMNIPIFDLAFRFGISKSTVSRIIRKWVFTADSRLSSLVRWPSRDELRQTMPFCFRPEYGLRLVSIIDCFEIFIEKPSNLLAKAATYSTYKSYNTAKYLISITPQGVISFVSNGYGGRVSDKFITEQCGYLKHLLPGDAVLADRGFNIEESIALQGATLDIPAFTRGKSQLSAAEVEDTRKKANVRIHVERIIGSTRQTFTILSATAVLPWEYVQPDEENRVLLDSFNIC